MHFSIRFVQRAEQRPSGLIKLLDVTPKTLVGPPHHIRAAFTNVNVRKALNNIFIRTAALGSLALAFASAGATDLNDHVSVSGFGTVGWVQTDSKEGQYRRAFQPKGADRDNGSALVDSNLGLQMTVKANEWLSATVQTLTAQRWTPDMSTRFEWAYVKATPLEGLSLRAGRMNLPNFMISDSRNIGYANNTLRPPIEVYGLDVLNDGLRGVEGSYRLRLGGNGLVITGLTGKSANIPPGDDRTDLDKVRGLNVQWEGDGYSLRIGRVEGKPILDPAINAFLPPGSNVNDELYSFTGVGFTVDRDNLVLQGESVQRRVKLFGSIINANAWYVMGGYRFGALLPYVQYSKVTPVNGSRVAPQDTTALGVRWDAFRAAAFKVQLERVNTHGTPGASFNTPTVQTSQGPAATAVTRPVTTLGVALDFVF